MLTSFSDGLPLFLPYSIGYAQSGGSRQYPDGDGAKKVLAQRT